MLGKKMLTRAAAIAVAAAAIPAALPVSAALAATPAFRCTVSEGAPHLVPPAARPGSPIVLRGVTFTTTLSCNKAATVSISPRLTETTRSGAVVARSRPIRVTERLAAGRKLAVNSVPNLPCRPGMFYQGTAALTATSGTHHFTETVKTKRVTLNCLAR